MFSWEVPKPLVTPTWERLSAEGPERRHQKDAKLCPFLPGRQPRGQRCLKVIRVGGPFAFVEINKDQPNKDKQILFRACCSKSQLPSLVFGRDSKAGRGQGSFLREGEAQMHPGGGCGL